MTDEELVATANSGRLINLAEQEIYPYIEKRITERMHLMRGKFAGGEKDFYGDIAYISSLMDLRSNLMQIQDKARKAFKMLEEKSNEQQ